MRREWRVESNGGGLSEHATMRRGARRRPFFSPLPRNWPEFAPRTRAKLFNHHTSFARRYKHAPPAGEQRAQRGVWCLSLSEMALVSRFGANRGASEKKRLCPMSHCQRGSRFGGAVGRSHITCFDHMARAAGWAGRGSCGNGPARAPKKSVCRRKNVQARAISLRALMKLLCSLSPDPSPGFRLLFSPFRAGDKGERRRVVRHKASREGCGAPGNAAAASQRGREKTKKQKNRKTSERREEGEKRQRRRLTSSSTEKYP